MKMMKNTWLMWPWWVIIPIEDLTDVTQATEDTDEDYEEALTRVAEVGALAETGGLAVAQLLPPCLQ